MRYIPRKGEDMSSQHCADHRVLEVIVRSPGSVLDDIVLECPDLTWNQVFAVIDRLSREGVLTMSPKRSGQYAIHLPNHARHDTPHDANR
jgi:hypothetical protein